MKNKKKVIMIVIAFILIMIFVFTAFIISNKITNKKALNYIQYNTFLEWVENKEIKEITISFDKDKFEFVDIYNNIFITDNPRNDNFKIFLLENEIKVNEINEKIKNVTIEIMIGMLRFGMIALLFFYISEKIGVGALVKKPEKLAVIPKINFKNIAGNEESKSDMEFLVAFLKNPKKYIDMGARAPKGIILYGPPGTGKTLMAKAIAGEAGVPFFNANGSDFVEMYAGLGARRIRELFAEAKKQSPCIIFIDEIDALGSTRGSFENSEKDQTINALLSELDGFNQNNGVLVIIATNRINDLDPALVRPGRFDRHIAIELPNYDDRLKILNIYAENKNIAEDVSIEQLSKLTIGFSGAGLETVLNEAAILAVNRGSKKIEQTDIDDAYFKMILKGNQKKDAKRDRETIEIIAWHEAGHALCAKLLTMNEIPKVTITTTASGVGGATLNIPKKMGLLKRYEILNNIKVLYAGRIGEFLLKDDEDEITTGASNDIKQATDLLIKYFNDYGMSEKYGMVKVSMIKDGRMSEEITNLSKKLYNETLELLVMRREILKKIAERLIEKETIEEKELDEIIGFKK